MPDRDIQIDPGIANEGAVRIVERAPQLDEMHELCNIEPLEEADLRYCPEVPSSFPSGRLRPSPGEFCVCPEGSSDVHALSKFFGIYAEDSDLGREGNEEIYGVALLDPDAHDDHPTDAVAYPNYWEPGRAGLVEGIGLDEIDRRVAPPAGRRIVDLTLFPFADQERDDVDLCNDNRGEKLSVGVHDLRFMVTDRPFFRPVDDVTGELGNLQPGVPDLAAGATYATIDYVFECVDPNDPEVKAHDDEQRRLMELDEDDPQREPAMLEELYCRCTGVDGE